MKHSIKKWLFPLTCASICAPSFCFFSCSKTQKPEIFITDSREAKIILTSPVETVVFSGFTFKNINDPDKLSVTNNFSLGLSTFKSSIINFNSTQKTFDVQVVCNNLVPQKIYGGFIFWYENKQICKSEDNDFVLTIANTPKITLSQSTPRKITIPLDKDGCGSCKFDGFKIFNLEDPKTNLTCHSTFEQVGTTINLSINYIDESNFEININFKAAKGDLLEGTFSFYNGSTIINDAPKDIFQIELISQSFITPPIESIYSTEINSDKGKLIIPGFIFSNVKKGDVIIEFTSELYSEELSVSIVNWNERFSTFDVEVDINNSLLHDYKVWFQFKNSTTGQPIHSSEDPIFIETYGVIPEDAFDIEEENGEIILNGIKTEWLDIIKKGKYSILRIPVKISKINDDAFKSIFTKDSYPKLKRLEFMIGSDLKTIGNNAFYGCNAFTNDLVLPYYLENIGDSAFYDSDFKSLSFTNLYQPITIGPDAFESNSSFKGDIILPYDTTLTYPGFAFARSGFNGTLYLPTKLNDDFNLCYLDYINVIDMTKYTSKPSWLGKNYNFDGAGAKVRDKSKYVYYGPSIRDNINEIKEDMIAHGLPAGDDSDPNNFIFKMIVN